MISAIITTCKREPEVVERALKSIINQTFQDLEIIIVDDSPSGFKTRLEVSHLPEKYPDNKILYIAHDQNKGACAARNTGLKEANGEFIAYLDDDDEWVPDKLQKQLLLFSDPDVGLVYCGYKIVNDTTNKSYIAKQKFKRGYIYPDLIKENIVGGVSFPLIRKKCLEEVNGFDVEMKSAQDADVWLRISAKHKIDYVEAPLVIYHVHAGDQITKNPKAKISGLEKINEKNIEYLAKHPHVHYLRIIKTAPYYAKDGRMKKALSIWCNALRVWPLDIRNNMVYLIRILLRRG